MECTCKHCGRIYEWTTYRKGFTQTRCNSCVTKHRAKKFKHQAVALLGGACSQCGYNKSVTALQFHHVDPTQKSFIIGGAHCRSWKKIKEELKKCILVCANCHHEIEHGVDPPNEKKLG